MSNDYVNNISVHKVVGGYIVNIENATKEQVKELFQRFFPELE